MGGGSDEMYVLGCCKGGLDVRRVTFVGASKTSRIRDLLKDASSLQSAAADFFDELLEKRRGEEKALSVAVAGRLAAMGSSGLVFLISLFLSTSRATAI